MKRQKNNNQEISSIRNVISRSFIVSSLIVLAVAFFASLLFNQHELNLSREDNLQKSHNILSQLLIPAVSISDSNEVLKLLNLSSDKNQIFAVIDKEGDDFLPNYAEMNLLQTYFHKSGSLEECVRKKASYQTINGQKYWVKCTVLMNNQLAEDNKSEGVLVSFSRNVFSPLFSLLAYCVIIAATTLALIAFWFRHVLHRRLLKPLTQLSENIVKKTELPFADNWSFDKIDNPPYEVKVIMDAFELLLGKFRNEFSHRTASEKKQALFDLAAKVAHDVRSPLAALEIGLSALATKMPEPLRVLMRDSIHRIRDIANDLLSKNRLEQNADQDTNSLQIVLLSSVIHSVVSEKRTQYISRENIKIIFESSSENYGLFSKIHLNEFKRLFSNVLNNAIESMEKGEVVIQLSQKSNIIEIILSDNGKGIPEDILKRLGNELGLTYGKKNGNGLGIYHAKKNVEAWNGKFSIKSVTGQGTQVYIQFPKETPPSWFVPELMLAKNQVIIVFDDDNAIHQIWNNRLEPFQSTLKKVVDLFTPSELIAWYREENKKHKGIIYLCDYEFLHDNKNGLDVIEELGIGENSILITSRFEEPSIRSRCEKLGVKMIPKDAAFYVPIKRL